MKPTRCRKCGAGFFILVLLQLFRRRKCRGARPGLRHRLSALQCRRTDLDFLDPAIFKRRIEEEGATITPDLDVAIDRRRQGKLVHDRLVSRQIQQNQLASVHLRDQQEIRKNRPRLYHRSTRAPITAPSTATKLDAITYQVATKSGLSSGQWRA
jgi:hypothetical protein